MALEICGNGEHVIVALHCSFEKITVNALCAIGHTCKTSVNNLLLVLNAIV